MKSVVLTTLAVAALGVTAAPAAPAIDGSSSFTRRRPLYATDNVSTDVTVLNFALTLEHLENAFYSGALAKYDEKAFTDAGLPSFARARFVEVGQHEQVLDFRFFFMISVLTSKRSGPRRLSD
jgi:Ferritin-like domain